LAGDFNAGAYLHQHTTWCLKMTAIDCKLACRRWIIRVNRVRHKVRVTIFAQVHGGSVHPSSTTIF
jgi:hypothetical protein